MRYKVGQLIRISITASDSSRAAYHGYIHKVTSVSNHHISTTIVKVLSGHNYALNLSFNWSAKELKDSSPYSQHIYSKVLKC